MVETSFKNVAGYTTAFLKMGTCLDIALVISKALLKQFQSILYEPVYSMIFNFALQLQLKLFDKSK